MNSTEPTNQKNITPVKALSKYFEDDQVKTKFQEVLGKNPAAYLSSVLTVVSQSDLLKNATKESIVNATLMAAALDLPLNQNLGFAYLVPYKRKGGPQEAQFQLGYKGYIQLAMRSGQFKTISATPIYQGQVVSGNPLTGYEFDFSVAPQGEPIGYAGYFELLNGFSKTLYSTVEELQNHGKKYSQSMKKGYGLWVDNFESMAIKTVLKTLLSKYAPMSVNDQLHKAMEADSAVINDVETMDVDYVDNPEETPVEKSQNKSDEAVKAVTGKLDLK